MELISQSNCCVKLKLVKLSPTDSSDNDFVIYLLLIRSRNYGRQFFVDFFILYFSASFCTKPI